MRRCSVTVAQLLNNLDAKLLSGKNGLNKMITGFYIGDMLSWVMANAKEGQAWITIQTNINVVAVGIMTDISCIIIAESAEVSPDTLIKAEEEDIPILHSSLTAYQIAVKCAGVEANG